MARPASVALAIFARLFMSPPCSRQFAPGWPPVEVQGTSLTYTGSAKFAEPPFETLALRLLTREAEGPLVGRAGFNGPSQPPAEIRPRRMSEVIRGQIATCQERVDQGQTRQGPVPHRDGGGAVQLDHGRRLRAGEHVVQPDDLHPVRRGGALRL